MQTPNEMLETAIIKLIFNKPFFANMLTCMKREFTTKVFTLGVSVTDTVNLYVNPHFFASLTVDQQAEILCHEVLHVVNAHMVRFKDLEPQTYQKVDANGQPIKKIFDNFMEDMLNASTLNRAADYAINESLPNLPEKFNLFSPDGKMIMEPDEIMDAQGNLTPNPNAGKPIQAEPCLVKHLQKKIPQVEKQKHLEYYYEFLKEENKKNEQNGQGSGKGKGGRGHSEATMDDHSMWNEGQDQDSEYTLEKIKQTVAKAVEATGGREAGRIPSDVLEAIERLNHKPRNWKQDLSKFVARTSEIIIESSRKIRNRRYGIIYPGIKTYPRLTIAACVDTSGSMSNEALSQIAAELDAISKNNVDVWVIEADCTVQNVWKFDAKKLESFQGRGGTAYGPALKYAEEELEVDAIMYFGDFDSSDRPKKPKGIPVLWVGVNTQQKPPADFGQVIYAEIKKKNK